MQHSTDCLTAVAVHCPLYAVINVSTAASGFFGCATSPDDGDTCSNRSRVPSGVLSNYS